MKTRLIIALASVGATAAHAEAHTDRVAALEARVAELEAAPRTAPLSFGSGTELDLYGYIKADLIYDFGYELGNTTFGLNAIGEASEEGDFFNATARQTRLGFRTTTQTPMGELGTQVEGDFYGEGETFRLRHATATLGGIRVGKYWTTFMPLSSYPATLDFQGLAAIPFARQTQLRYTAEFGGNFVAEAAIEESNGDSDSPVFIAALAYDTDPLLLRASVLTGDINDGAGGEVDTYGVNLSGTATFGNTTIDAAYTMGEGINSYMVFLGEDLDSDGDAIEMQAAYISLTQAVGDKLTLRAMYGVRENDTGATADSTEKLETIHVNANYDIVENTSVGVEYFYGSRDTFGGQSYDVDRVQASVTYTF
ncbi:hypothetical protein AN189_10510 [Loktanella sp. 3ANDIMAR09]|uniref:DcaP family trimeric outer membrane transporter n=1 Tax=Loktanella sp. 3ANDIMAR09 TaxID=1225657 RepID=UPI0007074ED1|nr:DcaP family trimeric outer membrane transporter [Loktanella sp. 3ANDIMAR09]KQI68406.1 hypothetical protein AN189_10510 [Loktanella sp. 3ANDIMAR09]